MRAVLYYISLPFLYLLASLPFWLLYRVSDFFFLLVYYLIGYRKKVVYQNLRNALPEKSETEIRQIARKFYIYFCDLILETNKQLTIGEKALRKRLSFSGMPIFYDYFGKNQSVIIVMGHIGNWELGGARFAVEPVHQLKTIYHPLTDPYFEKLIVYMRTRLGNGLYPMKKALRGMIADRNKRTATAFIADQTPSNTNVYWMEFMHQDTPVFTGPEKIAKKLNYPVIYIYMRQPKRGYYDISAEILCENPGDTAENEITEAYIRRLEADIRVQPEIWLWAHKRWKHKRGQD